MALEATPASMEGPGKGKAYFDRAKTVADTGNYDYAIDMYIEGLFREPLNIPEHEALRDISLRRKVKGGKPASGFLGAKPRFKGKTPKEQMLNAEWFLAKDPGNISQMSALLKHAYAADYKEIIHWFGPVMLHANRTQKAPHPRYYLELADLYEGIGSFQAAAEAVQLALQMLPNDGDLANRVKELAARETLQKGQYENAGDFKESLKDKEQTQELIQQDNLNKSEEFKLKVMSEAKANYEKDPLEHQVISKYVKSLIDLDSPDYEATAIDVLHNAYEKTKVYRYKMIIGDIRMKQFRRDIRVLAAAVKAHPDDTALQNDLQEQEKARLDFEIEEFAQRVKQFPTDMGILYEYGYRLYRARRLDEALQALQLAQNHPRHRADALYLLGRCFLEQGMKREAVETFGRAVESYELADTGDTKSKDMHYWLARSQEASGNIAEAEKIYSRITQWDITFRDARQRLADLRAKESR